MTVATLLLTACSGFLLAVLWMDLIFDAQVLAHRGARGDLSDDVLASIAGYYRRAVVESRPMSGLIPLVMLVLLTALAFRVTRGHDPTWRIAASIALAATPMLLALTRTVPHAARLGGRSGSPADQSALPRSILRDHLACAACVLAFLIIWVLA